jgi:UDP-N-acetylglucosamine acyltransferase
MSANRIHPTAIVDPGTALGADIEVGPYCIVGPGVSLGDGCWLQHHVTLCGPSMIGPDNRFFAYTSIGQQSQDLKYRGEPTHLEIGKGNTFREFATVNRGTLPDTVTRIGNRGNFLAYSHVAHDCTVGDDVIFSNNGTLAGHVEVEDRAIIGGLTAVHQFCRIGRFSMSGGCTKIVRDVPPFMIADGNPAEIRGINAVGMERHGFSAETIRAIKEAYRLVYRSKIRLQEAVAELEPAAKEIPEIAHLIAFIGKSTRGIIR